MITVVRWPKTSSPKETFSTMSKNTLRRFLCVRNAHLFGKGGLRINLIQKKDWLHISLITTILTKIARHVNKKLYKRTSQETQRVNSSRCSIFLQSLWIQSNKKVHLKKHSESIHLGVQYSCNQCEYKVTKRDI